MAEIGIEIGRPGDLERFLELLETAATWRWDRGIPQWAPVSMRAQESLLGEWTRSGHLVVARSGSDLGGGCILGPHSGPEWAGRPEQALYVQKLVVARAHAGQGIARRLLAWCADRGRAERAARLRLDCWDGNANLRSFYRGCGYRELEAVASHGYSVRLFELELP